MPPLITWVQTVLIRLSTRILVDILVYYIIYTDGFMSVPYFPSNDTLWYVGHAPSNTHGMSYRVHQVVNNVLTPVLPSRWSCCEWQ